MSRSFSFAPKKMMKWRYLFIVNLCLVLLISISLGRELIRAHEIQKQIKQLQTQADELKSKNLAMTDWQTSVQTESFVEREARLKLGLKKPGEQVVIVKDSDPKKTAEASKKGGADPLNLVIPEQSSPDKLANSTKWWYYFFHKQAYLELIPYESRL